MISVSAALIAILVSQKMNYPAAELRGIKMNFYLINPDAEHRGILLIKKQIKAKHSKLLLIPFQKALMLV